MMKQGIAITIGLALLWLLSAWEFGAVGNWVPIFVAGLVLFAVCSLVYSEWKWNEEERRRERKDRRMVRKIIEQTNKERYLRECA